jgi:hypothetical protein
MAIKDSTTSRKTPSLIMPTVHVIKHHRNDIQCTVEGQNNERSQDFCFTVAVTVERCRDKQQKRPLNVAIMTVVSANHESLATGPSDFSKILCDEAANPAYSPVLRACFICCTRYSDLLCLMVGQL